jgi:hypothetical protein
MPIWDGYHIADHNFLQSLLVIHIAFYEYSTNEKIHYLT